MSKYTTQLMNDYFRWEAIPAAKRAWVKIYAKQAGKSPTMAVAGVKAAFARRSNLLNGKGNK